MAASWGTWHMRHTDYLVHAWQSFPSCKVISITLSVNKYSDVSSHLVSVIKSHGMRFPCPEFILPLCHSGMDHDSSAAKQQQRLAEIAAERDRLDAEEARLRAATGPPAPLNTRCDAMAVTIARALSRRFPGCCVQSASCNPSP
jgi:hypothetical protein